MGKSRFTTPLGKARKGWTQELAGRGVGGGATRGELERQTFIWSEPCQGGAWDSAILDSKLVSSRTFPPLPACTRVWGTGLGGNR